MTAGNFEPSMLLAILPELSLVIVGALILFFDLLWAKRPDRCRSLGWFTASSMVAVIILSLIFSRPTTEPQLILGGMLRHDWLAFVFRILFLTGAAITSLFVMEIESLGCRGEFYLLLVASTFGMCLMAASADLIMLFLAIETTSIPLYVMAGFFTRDNKSTEAGFKYFLFGALTSAVMLYGFSLLFGFTGTTQIYQIADMVQMNQIPNSILMGVAMLILVGFGFKIAAVPLHFWAPDVYEGAPTPVTGFLSTASKAAGFAVLMRFVLAVFPTTVPEWTVLLATMATVTMILGNVLALAQKNIKRILAYSSIAQAGYILVGVAAISPMGVASATYYLMAYLFTNMVAFGIISLVGRTVGSDDLSAYAGLSRRMPRVALALLVAMLSLGGIPPFGGFIGKVLVFAAAVQANLVWLAVVGVLNSIVALYYYLNILKVVYLYRSEEEARPVFISRPWKVGIIVSVAGIILLGTLFSPWYSWAVTAASSLF